MVAMARVKTINRLKSLQGDEFLKVLLRYYKHNQCKEGVEDLITTYLKSGTKKKASRKVLLNEFNEALKTYNEPMRKLRRKTNYK